ncbi:SLOG family protein [Micromonospora sp. NPDC049081]|uniref:SLOG family protein n=1 Tax=Micromonospora sp. NPDC049081 TaxID=3155150 RepID=UPI0033E5170C
MSGTFRLLVTGSRGWDADTLTPDGHTIADVLDGIAASTARAGFDSLTVVHGACPKGADAVADAWCRNRSRRGWPVLVDRHPADWKRNGRGAGMVRNLRMVNLGADMCAAFILNGSAGATHCADAAEGAGMYVQRFHVSTAQPLPDFDGTDVSAAALRADTISHSPNQTTAQEAHA